MSDEARVTPNDCRQLGYCARGMRAFAAAHGLPWDEFLRAGVPASVVEATGDAMAVRAAAIARQRAQHATGSTS